MVRILSLYSFVGSESRVGLAVGPNVMLPRRILDITYHQLELEILK